MSDKKPTLLSRYRLLACLGRGGMAEVYLAVSQQGHGVSKLQVLKTLRRDLSDSERPEYLQMFEDEARLAARLNHPNIVQSHDVGFEEPAPFIAMEYLAGQPLSRLQERQWSSGQVNAWGVELLPICQVLDALEYAHALSHYDGTPLNVVHRDVSPQNIFVTYTGHTKLVDFGIAKTLDSKKTRAGVIKGKVAYMSPEQVRGQAVDHRSDVYSVGVILWETVARQCMHGQEPVLDILNRVVEGRLPQLKDIAPNAPDELCGIVERALACHPDDRYPSASAFREDLDRFLDASGRATERDLGKVVSELFAKERDEIGQAIRKALAQPAPTGFDPDTLRITPILGMFSAWNDGPEEASQPGAREGSTPPSHAARDSHTEKPVHLDSIRRGAKRAPWLLVGAAALVAGALWLGLRNTSSDAEPGADANAARETAIHIGGTELTPAPSARNAEPTHAQPATRVADPGDTTNAQPNMAPPAPSAEAPAVANASSLATAAQAPVATSSAKTEPTQSVAVKTVAPRLTVNRPTTPPAAPTPAPAKNAAPAPAKNKDPFDHDFSPTPRKRSSGGTLDTSNPWK